MVKILIAIQIPIVKKKKYCHSEEPSGDEESPKITLVPLFGGSFVALLLRMAHNF